MREMNQNSVLFSDENMKKVISGQTRLLIMEMKMQPIHDGVSVEKLIEVNRCPYKTGQLLNVRETFYISGNGKKFYKASYTGKKQFDWKPGFFMEEKDFRLQLKITSVSVKKLSELTDEEIIQYGIGSSAYGSDKLRKEFLSEWDKRHSATSLKRRFLSENDPYVWVACFVLLEKTDRRKKSS